MPSPVGDFDGTDLLDVSDVDLLMRHIWDDDIDGNLSRFDVTDDGAINRDDLSEWTKTLKHTWFGDANMDGEFNSLDLVHLLEAGQYKDNVWRNSTWSTGDWNADGEFDSADMVLALQDGGYGQGPRVGLAAVPEPSTMLLAFVGFLGLAVLRCNRKGHGECGIPYGFVSRRVQPSQWS